jgi:uncharacterized delta-60 repeat protein
MAGIRRLGLVGVALALGAGQAHGAGPYDPPPPVPGQLVTSFFPRPTYVSPATAALDASGRILAAGTYTTGYPSSPPAGTAIARFTASGQPDLSFGTYGAGTSDATGPVGEEQGALPEVVTPLADGSFLVGGFSVDHVYVERFDADGALDRSFGSGGVVSRQKENQGFGQRVLALAQLADGTIVFVHAIQQPQGASAKDSFPGGVFIDRLSPGGALLSEGNYGAPEWTVGTQTSFAGWEAAHVYPDGSVLAGGTMVEPITLPCPCTTHYELFLRRFRPDGSVDSSFGTGGRVTTDPGTDAYGQSLAVAADGTIVLGGDTSGSYDFVAARYEPDGQLDQSFGHGGTAIVARAAQTVSVNELALGPDGSVYLGSSGDGDLTVLKLDPGGAPAAGFGTGGIATSKDSGRPVALFPEGDGGVTAVVGKYLGTDFELARYTAAGAPDVAFGTPSIGVGVPPRSGALAVAASGTLIATAGFGEDEAGRMGMRVELLDRGSPSKKFGKDGRATLFLSDPVVATAVGIDPKGRIVAGGYSYSTMAGPRRWVVARFRRNGTLDPTFGSSGVVISPVSGGGDGVLGLAVLADSDMLLLALQRGAPYLMRLTDAGGLDPGYDSGGRLSVGVADASALAVRPDGSAVVCGDELECALLDARGVVVTLTAPVASDAKATAVALQPDGRILVTGATPDGLVLARLRADGTPDSRFGVVTRIGVQPVGIGVQRDGRIDVAVLSRGAVHSSVLRFLATGAVDSSFVESGIADAGGGIANAMAIVPGGILVASTVPSPRVTDFGLALLDQASLVGPVTGRLFHVTPDGVARRVARVGTQPVWSAASDRLAYVGDDAGAPGIWISRGGAGRLVVRSPFDGGFVVEGAPIWSRNGRLLAAQVLDPMGSAATAIFRAADGRLLHVQQASPATGATEFAYDPGSGSIQWFQGASWSPEGKLLAGFDHLRLTITDRHGHVRRLPVFAGEEAHGAAWSPDGKTIAFVNKDAGSYVIDFVDVASGKRIGRWNPGGGFDGATPSWDATGVYNPNG